MNIFLLILNLKPKITKLKIVDLKWQAQIQNLLSRYKIYNLEFP